MNAQVTNIPFRELQIMNAASAFTMLIENLGILGMLANSSPVLTAAASGGHRGTDNVKRPPSARQALFLHFPKANLDLKGTLSCQTVS